MVKIDNIFFARMILRGDIKKCIVHAAGTAKRAGGGGVITQIFCPLLRKIEIEQKMSDGDVIRVFEKKLLFYILYSYLRYKTNI